MLNSTYDMPAAGLPAGSCPASRVRGALSARALALAFVCCTLLPGRATAQQLVTDDAAIVDARACQLELWHGKSASWILPACQLLPRLELAAGIGFIPNGARERQSEFQVGLRAVLLAERLSADVSWGGHTAAGHDGAGWTAGIAWTPPSWF